MEVVTVPATVAQRVMYWHIESPYKFMIYPLMVVATAIFAYGVYRKCKYWMAAQPDKTRFNNWFARIKLFIWDTPLQARVLKDPLPGLMHVAIFWSFLALMLVTAIVFVDVDFKFHIYHGPLYLIVTLFADLSGLALLAGLVYAAFRRYIMKPDRLDNHWDDAFLLLLLIAVVATGFVLEGLRIHYTNDQWAAWSPIGYLVSMGLGGMSDAAVVRVYQSVWWFHFAMMFVFTAAFPYTKLFHIAMLPANIFFSSMEPKGGLPRVDIEALLNDEKAAENFNVGVSTINDQTWKMRMDYDACIRCGRCQDVCPAHLNQHPLSPKKFINDLKDFSWKEYQKGLTGGAASAPAAEGAGGTSGAEAGTESAPGGAEALIVGGAFDPNTIWECRTCRACMEACPAHIEHIPQVMELRRAEVMMRGQLPQDASIALKTMERTGNPFGPQEARRQWIEDAQIPVIGPGEECDVLFWIGCCTTYDLCKQKVAYNVIKILQAAGLKIGVLGDDEKCCGDPAKSLGDENIFQTIVKSQIELLKTRKFKYLVAHCAHCYNVFKNDYPQFGVNLPVVHHTELIAQLLKEGKLKFTVPIERTITYHDPCYLGRYNDIYEAPREILSAIKGIKLVEMKNNREKARCCGGGGGHYWMDIPGGERLNVARAKEAVETKADIVTVGCIYCLHMLDDAIKILNLDEKMVVYDISELVVVAMGGEVDTKLTCVMEKMAA